MANFSNQKTMANYDPRWFIWTIVFLLVSGIGLVTFIVTSSDSEASGAAAEFPASKVLKRNR
jgi:hypothetical protein